MSIRCKFYGGGKLNLDKDRISLDGTGHDFIYARAEQGQPLEGDDGRAPLGDHWASAIDRTFAHGWDRLTIEQRPPQGSLRKAYLQVQERGQTVLRLRVEQDAALFAYALDLYAARLTFKTPPMGSMEELTLECSDKSDTWVSIANQSTKPERYWDSWQACTTGEYDLVVPWGKVVVGRRPNPASLTGEEMYATVFNGNKALMRLKTFPGEGVMRRFGAALVRRRGENWHIDDFPF